MATLLIFSSIMTFILAEELPIPESLRQFGPYGRPIHYNSVSDVRSSYSDSIAGNHIRSVRKQLIKNHNTGANENHANSKNRNSYNTNNNINNRFTGNQVYHSNTNGENHYQPTNRFNSNSNFGPSWTNNDYITNNRNSMSDHLNSVSNPKYRDYSANSYNYENHDNFINNYSGSDTGSGNRGRDDIYNIHSGFRDAMNEYDNSAIEEFGITGEYGPMDATGMDFNPLQGLSNSGTLPKEIESHQNTVMQGPYVTRGQDISSSSTQLTRRKGRLQDSVSRQGHGGGGYNNDSGIDVYSLLALGLFAAFLGYVIFYYISVNGRRRSIDLSPQEYATLIMAEVFNALERWAVVELLPSVKNKDEYKLFMIRR